MKKTSQQNQFINGRPPGTALYGTDCLMGQADRSPNCFDLIVSAFSAHKSADQTDSPHP